MLVLNLKDNHLNKNNFNSRKLKYKNHHNKIALNQSLRNVSVRKMINLSNREGEIKELNTRAETIISTSKIKADLVKVQTKAHIIQLKKLMMHPKIQRSI